MKYKIEYLYETVPLEGEAENFIDFVKMNKHSLAGSNLYGKNLAYANLADANLAGANLAGANLADANLKGAYLAGANLKGASINFSAWPLWCGTRNVKVNRRIAAQIATHFCWLDCDNREVKSAQEALKPLAKQFKHWQERE